MDTLFTTLFRPFKSFREMKVAGRFPVMSLIVLLFLVLLNHILMIPVMEKITSLTFSTMSVTESQRETMTQVVHKMRYLQVAGTLIMYTISIFLYALLLYAIVYFARERLKYKEALLLITFSSFIIVLGDLINTGILYIRGIEEIKSTYEITFTGINMFVSVEEVGATLYTFLSCINPFQIAYIILLSIGLKVFTEAKYVKVILISLLIWTITILIPTLSVYFSELTLTKSGML